MFGWGGAFMDFLTIKCRNQLAQKWLSYGQKTYVQIWDARHFWP